MSEMQIDFAWITKHTSMDLVWYAASSDDSILVASNSDYDAIVIGDTPEDVVGFFKGKDSDTFGSGIENLHAKQGSLYVLASKWRWFIYNKKVRFLIEGNGWSPTSLGEFPGWQCRIASDPYAMCYFAVSENGYITHKEAVIVGGSLDELTNEFQELGIDKDLLSGGELTFQILPLATMQRKSEFVWFRGKKHNVEDILKGNPYTLMSYIKGMMTEKEMMEEDEE